MNKCTRCGGLFPTRTSGILPGVRLCSSQQGCDANIAKRITELWEAAAADLGPDLGGMSVLDLAADNLPHIPLAELRAACARAGFTKYEVMS